MSPVAYPNACSPGRQARASRLRVSASSDGYPDGFGWGDPDRFIQPCIVHQLRGDEFEQLPQFRARLLQEVFVAQHAPARIDPRPNGMPIPPVFIVNSGRCGSTMLSEALKRHPRILSLSEFFANFHAYGWYRHPTRTGDQMWRLYSRPTMVLRRILEGRPGEVLYAFDAPGARFNRDNLPPVMQTALPHLTDRHETLYDELESVVRSQPRQAPALHFRHLFAWLCERFGKDVWVERSGGSSAWAFRLLGTFPEARLIHLYRDGREVALSMSRHPAFRETVRYWRRWRSLGLDMRVILTDVRPAKRSAFARFALGVLMEHVRWRPRDEPRIEEFGHMWSLLVEIADRALAQLPPDRALNVRFEDVQADPEGELRRLVRFIGPDLEDEDWLREVSSIPRPTSSRFARLGVAEQAALTEACRPGLDLLGYPP